MLTPEEKDVVESTLQDVIQSDSLSRDEVNAILNGYGEYLGLNDLSLDANDTAGLEIDEAIAIGLIYVPGLPGVIVAAELDSEIADHPSVLKMLLQANLSWEATQGGTFAIVPPENDVLLCRFLALTNNKPHESIDRELGMFVELVETWQETIDMELLADEKADDAFVADEFRDGMIRA